MLRVRGHATQTSRLNTTAPTSSVRKAPMKFPRVECFSSVARVTHQFGAQSASHAKYLFLVVALGRDFINIDDQMWRTERQRLYCVLHSRESSHFCPPGLCDDEYLGRRKQHFWFGLWWGSTLLLLLLWKLISLAGRLGTTQVPCGRSCVLALEHKHAMLLTIPLLHMPRYPACFRT